MVVANSLTTPENERTGEGENTPPRSKAGGAIKEGNMSERDTVGIPVLAAGRLSGSAGSWPRTGED